MNNNKREILIFRFGEPSLVKSGKEGALLRQSGHAGRTVAPQNMVLFVPFGLSGRTP